MYYIQTQCLPQDNILTEHNVHFPLSNHGRVQAMLRMLSQACITNGRGQAYEHTGKHKHEIKLKYKTLKARSSMYIYSIAKYRVSLVYTNLSKFCLCL